MLIKLRHVVSVSLVEPTVQKDFESVVQCDKMSAAGDFPGGAAELYFHRRQYTGFGRLNKKKATPAGINIL